WFASIGADIWQKSLTLTNQRQEQINLQLNQKRLDKQSLKTESETLKSTYMEMGGAAIEDVKRTIQNETERLREKQNNSNVYQNLTKELKLNSEVSPEQFATNQKQLTSLELEIQNEHDTAQSQLIQLQADINPSLQLHSSIKQELESIRERPSSNIEARFQLFRDTLAEELQLRPEDTPFLAEMIEVKNSDKEWRGAIERALGSERLRILVPAHHFQQALRWINHRDNKLHVRLLSARDSYHPQRPFHDSFIHKISIKQHELSPALHDLLIKQDRHCIQTVEELESTEHAMTLQGSMSGRKGKVDKQDQRRITDGWMTGFDNKDRITELEKSLAETELHLQSAKTKATALEASLKKFQHLLVCIAHLKTVEFSTIDTQSVQRQLDLAQSQLDALTDPTSDLAKARESYEKINTQIDVISRDIESLVGKAGGIKVELKTAQQNYQSALDRMGNGLDDDSSSIAEKKFPRAKNQDPQKLPDAERSASSLANTSIDKHEATKATHLQKLTKFMEFAKSIDTGALAESSSELIDIPTFLTRLKALEEEDLPQRQERFEQYLNLSSGQGVTQLLTNIDNNISHITHRIESLNTTLSRVEFKQGKHLQLDPVKVSHDSLKILDNARKHLNFAMTKDDQGESHFKALKVVIEILREAGTNTRTLASKALLDPRHRLEFYVVEVCRETQTKSGRISGSQSGSGGEKEMMASYILTASLSYALCPDNSENPRYATIVLDEAFSKSSQAAATRIIKALRAFGLHPLFVTPNKEMSLL
ncbi:MAG: SbcC/MukB-like Walker B domain-containing protein, partial [Rubritalea sp.]|uniref:ATP-binding protein n=1 Tax=Rubritalea sp. TaxID=2109375 RepID=UPI0032429C23